jgi:glutathione S-transferase
MLTLRSSATSPFGRKVKIAAKVLDLWDRIEVVPADTTNPEDSLNAQNPLGKIPILILEDGTPLYDSRVIVDYLDYLAGGDKLIPPAPARYEALLMQALADGIVDAGILRVYETRFRPADKHVQSWLDYQTLKVERGLARAASGTLPEIRPCPDIGAISLACALGYMDFRFAGWRTAHPALSDWVDRFETDVPAFVATKPPA